MTVTRIRRHIQLTQGRIGRVRSDFVRRELYARLDVLQDQLAAAQAAAEQQDEWAA